MSPNISIGQTKHIHGLKLTKEVSICQIGHRMHGRHCWRECCIPGSSTKDPWVGRKGADKDGGARKSARCLSPPPHSTQLTELPDNHCSHYVVRPQNDGQEKHNSLSKVTSRVRMWTFSWGTYLQGRNIDADIENGLVDTVGNERVGRIESVALAYIYILPGAK